MHQRPQIKVINAKYKFSDSELSEIADKTADLLNEIEVFEQEKKEETARLNQKLKAFKESLFELGRCKRDKFQYRDLECRIEYNLATKEKEYYWTGDGRLVKTEAMSPEEIAKSKQLSMLPQ